MQRAQEAGPVAVPAGVREGLEAVRRSNLTNMLDRPAVIEIAASLGFPETADWVDRHRREYAEGIFRGFRAVEP